MFNPSFVEPLPRHMASYKRPFDKDSTKRDLATFDDDCDFTGLNTTGVK